MRPHPVPHAGISALPGPHSAHPKRNVAHRRVLQDDGPHTGGRRVGAAGDAAMATDYDAPRRRAAEEVVEDSLEVLQERHRKARSPVVDVEETDTAEGFELPGADLSGEEFSVRVVPKQADEFTCSRCFLVHHRHRYAGERGGLPICRDCAA